MRKALRYLRIAWSVGCGILCLLLIALWVRSYWWTDNIYYRPGHLDSFRLKSQFGVVQYTPGIEVPWRGGPHLHMEWVRHSYRYYSEKSDLQTISPIERPLRGVNRSTRSASQIPHGQVRYWHFVILSATIAAAPWFRWRFSLRTLLIAMTLVAVLLGVIVYSMR
jgi:hypothetical protein